ncbi:MAG: lipoprotein [Bacteroidota bacterium]|jgi:hypothetical protein|nr:lipoprotein [Bacteroidota bacterium]
MNKILVALVALLMLSACGNSPERMPEYSPDLQTGVIDDSAVTADSAVTLPYTPMSGFGGRVTYDLPPEMDGDSGLY